MVVPIVRVIKVVVMRIIGGGGGGGFVVRLDVGDEVVDGGVEMLSRETEVDRRHTLKICFEPGEGREKEIHSK